MDAEVEIAAAGEEDVGTLAAVHLETVLHAYARIFPPGAPSPSRADLEADWYAAVADRETTVLIAIAGSDIERRIVGTVRCGPHRDHPGEGQLARLHVLPSWWNRGVGGKLHDAAVAALADGGWPAASLWVLEDNARARAFYEKRGWIPVGGYFLDRPGLPREVRYRLQLRRAHEQHDAVSETVRGWYTASTPELGIRAEPRWFGSFTHVFGTVEARATLTVDDPGQVGPALADARDLAGGAELQVWIDDRDRARLLADALAASGFEAAVDTTYLALVGPVAAHPAPRGLAVEEVGDARLGTWAAVKVRGFADRESAAEAEVAAEVAQRRVEAPLARYLLGVLDGEPVAALAHYTGADQLVFSLATRVPWRHRGIGQTLLARWAADGISADCRSLIINATEGGPAEALYRRMGFVDEVYWHRRHERLPR